MIVWVVRFYVDKGKEAEYAKLGKEVSLPSIHRIPGLIEMRGYRNWTTDQVQIEYEFESLQAWAKYMEDPKSVASWEQFKSNVHGITSELLGPGLLTPEPIRP